MSSSLSAANVEQLTARGITVDEAERQLALLKEGTSPVTLVRAARSGDGIVGLSDEQLEILQDTGIVAAASGRVTKFVPASGAATRMFEDLASLNSELPDERALAALRRLAAAREVLPFAVPEDPAAARTLFYGEGGLARLPKGLVPFHRYPGGSRTAIEEHLVEAALFARDETGRVAIHFTIAPSAREDLDRLLALQQPRLEGWLGCRFAVSVSYQDPSTDTLASDAGGLPLQRGGALVFRPGGHGALIRNLQQTNADLALIRNIDNVVIERDMPTVVRWHLVLLGFLVQLQTRAHDLLAILDGNPEERCVRDAERFLRMTLGRPTNDGPLDARHARCIESLDRPWRVCGMVPNDGEPGGGPFWIESPEGPTLQIIESAQISPDEAQKRTWSTATHFNPVHLACGLKDWRGRSFDLDRFADQGQSFVAGKQLDGKPVRVLERPGLWNGSMAGWNTVFVEVPAATFAPVKSVFDLLRPTHLTLGTEAA